MLADDIRKYPAIYSKQLKDYKDRSKSTFSNLFLEIFLQIFLQIAAMFQPSERRKDCLSQTNVFIKVKSCAS